MNIPDIVLQMHACTKTKGLTLFDDIIFSDKLNVSL